MPAHGIASIYTSRRFHIFMRRTTISHFSFLISHLIEVFKRNQVPTRPKGALNPEPWTLNHKKFKKPVDTIAQGVIILYPSLMKRPRSKERWKRFQKNHLTNLFECGKIIKSLEERWFFENWTVQRTNQADVRGSNTEQWIWARQEIIEPNERSIMESLILAQDERWRRA